MLHRVKKYIVVIFAAAIVFAMSTGLIPGYGDVHAEVGSLAAGEDISYDKNGGVLASMGFDTSKMPATYDADATTNPYGSNVSNLNEVDEAVFFDLREAAKSSVLYGHNNKLNGNYDEFVSSPVSKSVSDFIGKDDFVSAVKLDINGDGRDSAVALVYTHHNVHGSNDDGKIYMRIFDPFTGRKTEAFEISDLLYMGRFYRVSYDYQIQSMLQISAGDYDKDSVDEIAVYAPGKVFDERNRIMFFDLTDGTDCKNPYSKDSWRHSWNYTLPDYSQEIVNINPDTGKPEYAYNLYNNVDLTSGDADNDGIDDIIISYGASDTEYARNRHQDDQGVVRSISSKSVLLYGSDDGQMLRDSQNISYGNNSLIRVSFAFGDVDADGNEDMFVAGQLRGEQGKNTSRVIGRYTYDKDAEKMTLESLKNMNVVEGTTSNGNFYSANGWDGNYYSAPLMKTNLAVGNIMGNDSDTKIYLDSVLYSYDSGNYAIEDELEDTTKDKNNKYKGSCVFGGDKAFEGGERAYYEFGADVSNFTAANTDYILVNRVSTSKGYSGLQADDVNATSSILLADGSKLIRHDIIRGSSEYGGVAVSNHFSGSPVVAAAADTDKDGLIAEYTGVHNIQYQDPAVLAVLASPPYFSDVAAYDDNDLLVYLNTEYGTSSGTSNGYETEFECQLGVLMNAKIGSGALYGIVNAGAGYARSETWGWEKEREFKMSYGTEGGEDAVVMYSVPTENYVYKVRGVTVDDDGNTEEFTNTMVITKPHNPVTQTLTLEDYNEIQKRYSEKLPDVSKYLTSTPGDPSSYPSSEKDLSDEALAHIDQDTEHPIDCGEKWAGVSFGSGSITQELSYSKETRDRYDNHKDGAWCTVGGGVGNETNAILFFESAEAVLNFDTNRVEGTTKATLEGADCSGTIKNMPRSAKGYGYDFSWKLLKYNIKDKGCTFPVVSYIVNDVTSPPELPQSIEQDFDKTTDSQIALTWTYNKGNPMAFDIYRYEDFPVGGGEKLVGTVEGGDYKVMKDEDGNTLRDKGGRVVRGYSFVEDGLTADTKYQYRVKVRTAKLPGESIFSPIIEARTDVGTRPDLSLSADDLTIYPDGTYNIKVNLADPENYQKDISYQWQKYDLKNRKWEDIEGCDKQILQFYNCTNKDAGTYRCRVNLIRKKEGTPQYISAFTKSCDVGFSLRTVGFGPIRVFDGEGESGTNTGLCVNLKNTSTTSLEKPTGLVTFTISGPNGNISVAGTIDEETGDVIINSIEDRIQDLGQKSFVDGGYVITCAYDGNNVFSPANNEEEYNYLRNIRESKFLSMKSSYFFGEDVAESMGLYDYKSTMSGRRIKEDLTDKITKIKFYKVDPDGIHKAGNAVDTYDMTGGSAKAPVPLNKVLAKKAYVEVYVEGSAEPAASKVINTRKLPLELRIMDRTTGTGDLLHFLTGDDVEVSAGADLNEKNIETEQGKKSLAQLMIFTYYEQSGDVICNSKNQNTHKDDFVPASYNATLSLESDTAYFYTPVLKGGRFTVVGSYYMVSAGPDNASAGQVRMISPDNKVNFTNEGFVGGTNIVLKAEPNSGYEVGKWIVDDCGIKTTYPASEKLTYIVRSQSTAGSGNITITAVLRSKDNRLKIGQKGEGSVTVSPDVKSGDRVLAGTRLKFKAVPDEGWRFEEWRWTTLGGDNIVSAGVNGENGSNTKEFTMPDSSAEVYALFSRETVDVMIPDGLEVLYVNNGADPYHDFGELVKTEKGSNVPRGAEVTVRTKPGTILIPGTSFNVMITDGDGIVSVPVRNTISQGRTACEFTLPGDARTCLVSADTIKGRYSVNAETENVDFTISVDGQEMDGNTAEEIAGGSQVDIRAKVTDRGKRVYSWIINGEEKKSSDTIYTCNITENMNVAVTTEPVVGHDMKISTEGGGTLEYIIKDAEGTELKKANVSGEMTDSVYPGESILFRASGEDEEHTLTSITVNGDNKTLTEGAYTENDVGGDLNVKALFSPNKYYSVKMHKGFRGKLTDGRDCIALDAEGGEISNGEIITIAKNADLIFSVVVPDTNKAYARMNDGNDYIEPYKNEQYDEESTRYWFRAENITSDITITLSDHKTYYISTPEELTSYFRELAADVNSESDQPDGVLLCDIDMSGKSIALVKEMYALFDGNGYQVSNLKIGAKNERKLIGSVYSGRTYFNGIFGHIGKEGEIRNVLFRNLQVYGMVEYNGGGTGLLAKINYGTISEVKICDSMFNAVHENGRSGAAISGIADGSFGTVEHCVIDGLELISDCYPGTGGVRYNAGSLTGNYITGLKYMVIDQGEDVLKPAEELIVSDAGYSTVMSTHNYYRQTYGAQDSHGINAFSLTDNPGDKAKAVAEEDTPEFSRKLAYIMNKTIGKDIYGVSANDPQDRHIGLLSEKGETYRAPIRVEYVVDDEEAAAYYCPGTVKLAGEDLFGDKTPIAWEVNGSACEPGNFVGIESDITVTALDDEALGEYVATLSGLDEDGNIMPGTTAYYKDVKDAIKDAKESTSANSRQEIGIIGNARLSGEELNVHQYTTLSVRKGGTLTIPAGLQINNYGRISIQEGATVHKYGALLNEGTVDIDEQATFYNYGSALMSEQSVTGRQGIICKPHVFGKWLYKGKSETDDKIIATRECTICGKEETGELPWDDINMIDIGGDVTKEEPPEEGKTSDNTVAENEADESGQTSRSGSPSSSSSSSLANGASAKAAEKTILAMKSDDDPDGSAIMPLQLRSNKQTKKSLSLTWRKQSKDGKYVIYGNKCGKKNKMKKITTTKKTSVTLKKIAGKKVKKGTYYKFIMVAVDKNGNVVSTSKVIHVASKGGKVGNPTKLIIKKPKKSKVTLKKGKTTTISAQQSKSKKVTVKKHVSLRYESSNTRIATVSSKGKVKAKKKGACKIYVYTQNGLMKTVKVTVKG